MSFWTLIFPSVNFVIVIYLYLNSCQIWQIIWFVQRLQLGIHFKQLIATLKNWVKLMEWKEGRNSLEIKLKFDTISIGQTLAGNDWASC